MIEFTLPQLSMSSVTEYSQFPELMSAATSAIGFTISLGQKFVTSGISDIDTVIFPKLRALLPEGVWPRVVPGSHPFCLTALKFAIPLVSYSRLGSSPTNSLPVVTGTGSW